MSNKRKFEPEEIESRMEEVGLTTDVLASLRKSTDSTQIVGAFLNRLGIKHEDLKRARVELPSFSDVTWERVCEHFKWTRDFNSMQYDAIPTIPQCQLPASFHRTLWCQSWRALDLYGEPTQLQLEAPRVRLLDVYIVPIFSLFAGRVMDFPERAMPATPLSSGGSVEHEFVLLGNVLFLVVELKQIVIGRANYVAQLFAELFSASELNKRAGFERLLVYGLLTDLTSFQFFAFDPVSRTFYRDLQPEVTIVVSPSREGFLEGMIQVSEYIFSIALQAYLCALEATCINSQERQDQGSLSPTGSSPLQQLHQTPSQPQPTSQARLSLTKWQQAHGIARSAQTMMAASYAAGDQHEEAMTRGLELLHDSVGRFKRLTQVTTTFSNPTGGELETMAASALKKHQEAVYEASRNAA
ncbi:hypothetical protein C8R47DRAFT_1222924 [Mycena vitilis]|nr:hypothetical protein C8R47DRAFT_1222924 [Mycena vitilis]